MAIANFKQLLGGGKQFDIETGSFQFSGTTDTAAVPTNLGVLHHATFTPVTGTTFTNPELIYLQETAIGTAGTAPRADFYGGVLVTGTAVDVARLVTSGTAVGTGVTNLWVTYMFVGVSK